IGNGSNTTAASSLQKRRLCEYRPLNRRLRCKLVVIAAEQNKGIIQQMDITKWLLLFRLHGDAEICTTFQQSGANALIVALEQGELHLRDFFTKCGNDRHEQCNACGRQGHHRHMSSTAIKKLPKFAERAVKVLQ